MSKRPNRAHPHPNEFFVLGSKSKQDGGIKSGFTKKPIVAASGLKRNPQSTVQLATNKRLKTSTSASVFPFAGSSTHSPDYRLSPTVQSYQYEEVAIDVEGQNLVELVEESMGDEGRVEGLLCGAVRHVRNNKNRPDPGVCYGLLYLAKTKPFLFQKDNITESLVGLLRRDSSNHSRGYCQTAVLACNLLYCVFNDDHSWPDVFVKVFLEDSLSERVWVDRGECSPFVNNIITAFNTKLPDNKNIDVPAKNDESEELTKTPPNNDFSTTPVLSRFTYEQPSIESYTVDKVKDQVNRRQSLDGGSKNLIKTMVSTCGLPEVRSMAVQKLELWLQSPKLLRVAQELLMAACMNCDPSTNQSDLDLINAISRIKNKSINNHFRACIKELLGSSNQHLPQMLQQIVTNEMGASRASNNMSIISIMLHQHQEVTCKLLAELCLDNLTSRDDNLRGLRLMIREVARTCKGEFNIQLFVSHLLQDRSNSPEFKALDPLIKERYILSVVDLVCMMVLLVISPAIKEAASAVARLDLKDVELIRGFQKQTMMMQRDVVWWLQTIVTKMASIKSSDFMHCLRKVLFVEKAEYYSKVDNWPSENDKRLMLKLSNEVPVAEELLFSIVMLGSNRDLHLSTPELIDLVDKIVRRAASLYSEDFVVLRVERVELIDALLGLCAYKHPENTVLPPGYMPPKLAITSFFWKAYICLLIIAAYNPKTIGLEAWKSYPTLKCLMEMVMTNNYNFPPVTMATEQKEADEMREAERQMAETLKQQTIDFECHLAGSTITQFNSRLISQVSKMDPTGPMLRPPTEVMDSLKQLNNTLHLGRLLCQSRQPADFLLSIIQRQGASQSMPWLRDLVENNESSFEDLPVQCLCEFLINNLNDEDERCVHEANRQQKHIKQEQLLERLQKLVRTSNDTPRLMHLTEQVLYYFLNRLQSPNPIGRLQALKCLSLVLSKPEEVKSDDDDVQTSPMSSSSPMHEFDWLLVQLPSIHHFDVIKNQACVLLRHACQVETSTAAVGAYIIFLCRQCQHASKQQIEEMVLDMSQLIVERTNLVNCLLPRTTPTTTSSTHPSTTTTSPTPSSTHPSTSHLVLSSLLSLFSSYLQTAQNSSSDEMTWQNTQDQILLQWSSGKSANLNILIVHAIIIILIHGPPIGTSKYEELLNCLYPINEALPTAYLLATSEEALLLPDWLKLRMIWSGTPRLFDAALADLEASQLLLSVQSFGVPVEGMSRLLELLDATMETNAEEMRNLVVDKDYMGQIIHVQHMRGATGGERFYQLLNAGVHLDSDVPSPMEISNTEPTTPPQQVQPLQTKECSSDEITPLLKQMFTDTDTSTHDKHKSLRKLMRLMSTPQGKVMVAGCLNTMVPPIPPTTLLSSPLSPPLFKILLRDVQLCDVEGVLVKILSVAPPSPHHLVTIINNFLNKIDATKLKTPQQHESKPATSVDDLKTKLSLLIDPVVNINTSSSSSSSFSSSSSSPVALILLEMLQEHSDNEMQAGLILDHIEKACPRILEPPSVQQIIRVLFRKQITNKTTTPSQTTTTPPQTIKGEHEAPKATTPPKHTTSHSHYLLPLVLFRVGWPGIREVINILLPNKPAIHPSTSPHHAIYEQDNNFNEEMVGDGCNGGVVNEGGMVEENGEIDGGMVVWFLEACFNMPSLWSGRDKKTSRWQPVEDVMGLKEGQVRSLTLLIVRHLASFVPPSLLSSTTPPPSTTSSPPSTPPSSRDEEDEEFDGRLGRLMHLLEVCCGDKKQKLMAVRHTLMHLTNHHNNKPPHPPTTSSYVAQSMLWHLYIKLPHLFTTQVPTHIFSTLSTQADIMTHRVSNGMFDGGRVVTNANIMAREIASLHPVVLLRQLPLMISMLEGKLQLTYTELRNTNSISLFNHYLNLLHLLTPHIFHPDHHHHLSTIINIYVNLMQHGLNNKVMGSMVSKFFEFLTSFLKHQPITAHHLLTPHRAFFEQLSHVFPDMIIISTIISNLQHSTHSIGGEEDYEVLKDVQHRLKDVSTPWPHSQTWLLHRMMTSFKMEEQEALRKLDESSKFNIAVLEQFVSPLKDLMSSKHPYTIEAAHNLVMRLVRFKPSYASKFVEQMKRCLTSSDQHLQNKALSNLKEFSCFAREHAADLLMTSFRASMTSQGDMASYITNTLHLFTINSSLW